MWHSRPRLCSRLQPRAHFELRSNTAEGGCATLVSMSPGSVVPHETQGRRLSHVARFNQRLFARARFLPPPALRRALLRVLPPRALPLRELPPRARGVVPLRVGAFTAFIAAAARSASGSVSKPKYATNRPPSTAALSPRMF